MAIGQEQTSKGSTFAPFSREPLGGPLLESNFAIERELGRGGMGVVYLARDKKLGRTVAIKALLPETRESHRERFLREARMAAQLSHPHIVTVHQIVESANQINIVSAYIEGETLAEHVTARGPLDSREAGRILREVAWGLGYAHARCIIHRDIKPDNILLERGSGRAFIADFGIARDMDASSLTATGALVGSVQYMSPEQASGEQLDGRSDLYSLGVTGYYIVTGAFPITGATVPAILVNHLTMVPQPISKSNDRVSPVLAAAIERCLAKRPEDRFASAEEFARAMSPVVGQQTEIPPLVRAWLSRDELVFPVLLMWLLPIAFAPSPELHLIAPQVGGEFLQRVFALIIGGIPALAGALVFRVMDLRQLLRAGFRPDDVRFAVTAYAVQRTEELAAMRRGRSRRSRFVRRLAITGATAISALTFYNLLTRPLHSVVYEVSGLLTGLLALMYAVSSSGLWNKIRQVRARLWNAAAGRLLFRLARRSHIARS